MQRYILSYLRRALAGASLATSMLVPAVLHAQAASDAKPSPDVLVFTNGDQLTGKLVRATGGTVVFHSDMAGDLNVTVDKIKELRSSGSFAVLKKDQKVVGTLVRPGSVQVANGTLSLMSGSQTIDTIPVGDLGYIVDEATFRRETNPHPSLWYGWNGSLSGGATLVRSTQTGTTLTAAGNFIRVFPTVPYLPPRFRTTANISETYGTSRSPTIPQTVPPTPDAVVKTNIFHADAEHDVYLSRRVYLLADLAEDHNYSLGLNLQQLYGGGIGWTPIMDAKQQLDLKADVHYEKQSFFNPAGNQNLIGSTFFESYHYNLPRSIVFTQNANYIASWNDTSAYSANAFAGLTLPIFKRFAANVNATDNFINNPSPGYNKNSFQFVTGVTYTLK